MSRSFARHPVQYVSQSTAAAHVRVLLDMFSLVATRRGYVLRFRRINRFGVLKSRRFPHPPPRCAHLVLPVCLPLYVFQRDYLNRARDEYEPTHTLHCL